MFAVGRVKSLARAQKAATSKRQRLGDQFAIEMFDPLGDVPDDADSLAKWLRSLDILANTWALAGCFDVVWNSARTNYAHWEQTQAYVYDIHIRVENLLLKYYPYNFLAFAVQCEEDFRAAAMQLARDDPPVPWGVVLNMALKESHSIWSDKQELLGPKLPHLVDRAFGNGASSSGGGDGLSLGAPNGGKGQPKKRKAAALQDGGKGAKGKGHQGQQQHQQQQPNRGPTPAERKKWCRTNYAANGSWICQRHNNGGCRKPCPDNGLHCCDVTLANGWGCDQHNHNRGGHNPASHGAPKTR